MVIGEEHEEQQYLRLVRDIITTGERRSDRTGTGTLSLFAPAPFRFSLSNPTLPNPTSHSANPTSHSANPSSHSANPSSHSGRGEYAFPLLTTKRVFWRGVAEELLWFVRGDTNATHLQHKGIRIWDGNASRAYLDSIGLTHRREGDLGPVYGFQWRHFGANYIDCDTDYTGKGVDQLAQVIDKILHHPHDRRIILTAWNPSDMHKMALPPCHMFCQFYVNEPLPSGTGRKRLSCQLYQRSCDIGLGVPFNIASYALLTRLIAHVCDMEPHHFIHTMGDAHVYSDHVDALKLQLEREPRAFPRLLIKTPPGGGLEALERITMDDLELMDYHPHGKIHMPMSV